MRLPAALVAILIGGAILNASGWAQVPDLDRSDSAGIANGNPYSLPRSAPFRQPAIQNVEEEPSRDAGDLTSVLQLPLDSRPAEEPATEDLPPVSAAADSATAQERTIANASHSPVPPAKSSESNPPAEVTSANPADVPASENQDAGIAPETSLQLPEFVPEPIRIVWDKIVAVWRRKVFMDVTLEKFCICLALFLFSYIAAKRISRWFATRVLGRLGIGKINAATIQTIAFYALVAAFTLSTLGALGVPVTVFSYFGGALAVGIGFGSQNIVNNFISGLILLAERPIRVGDVIQIDGMIGKVAEIGARSTRVTTGSNMEILVPNSTILQSNVVNWTLSDDVISSKVTVGVAYGSPARQVAALLLKAAQQNTDILSEPAPGVSFTNFGDHALEFELSFWLRLSDSDRGKVESDLRFAIDDLFAEHGIIIAYPQRDVHLNLLRPVEVKLSPPASELRRVAA